MPHTPSMLFHLILAYFELAFAKVLQISKQPSYRVVIILSKGAEVIKSCKVLN